MSRWSFDFVGWVVCVSAQWLSADEVQPSSIAIGPARLVIARDGVTLVREGERPFPLSSIADLLKEFPGLQGSFDVEMPAPRPGSKVVTMEARKGRRDSTATISQGEIRALELVRYLADATGLLVLYDSADNSVLERRIVVAAPTRAGVEVVRAMLEANRIRVTESSSGAEGRVLRVESMEAPQGHLEPKPVPIFEVKDGRGASSGSEATVRRVAKGPKDGPVRLAGMVLEEVPEILRSQLALDIGRGVLVAELDEASVKENRALSVLKRFDLITHVGDRGIHTPRMFVEALNELPKGSTFQYRIIRKGTTTILLAEKR